MILFTFCIFVTCPKLYLVPLYTQRLSNTNFCCGCSWPFSFHILYWLCVCVGKICFSWCDDGSWSFHTTDFLEALSLTERERAGVSKKRENSFWWVRTFCSHIKKRGYITCQWLDILPASLWKSMCAQATHTHTVATSLGRPVNRLVNASTLPANRMAATQCIKVGRHGQEVQLLFRPNIRMKKKWNLSDFDRGLIVGARQGGLSILETDLLGMPYQCDVRGEWPAVTHITIHSFNSGMQNCIS